MTTPGQVRDRDLRVVAAAICLSALGDGVALIALALRAMDLSGHGMGGGIAVAAIFICLWAPVVLLAGYVGLLVDRVETRALLVAVSRARRWSPSRSPSSTRLRPSMPWQRCSGSGSPSPSRRSSPWCPRSQARGRCRARTGRSRRHAPSDSPSARCAAACWSPGAGPGLPCSSTRPRSSSSG